MLFDLDGTLLDVDMDTFLPRYFAALEAATSPRFPGVDVLPAVLHATRAMQREHPGFTNERVFADDFLAATGIDIRADHAVFDDFYRDVFPTLGDGAGPASGVREVLDTARSLGLKVAVATQPIFPASAIAHRLAWAGLAPEEFDVVTTYETMHACKPHPAYFEQTASMLGCAATECVMVGDDREMDLPASALGMRTYYVGDDPHAQADHRGDLHGLKVVLERLAR